MLQADSLSGLSFPRKISLQVPPVDLDESQRAASSPHTPCFRIVQHVGGLISLSPPLQLPYISNLLIVAVLISRFNTASCLALITEIPVFTDPVEHIVIDQPPGSSEQLFVEEDHCIYGRFLGHIRTPLPDPHSFRCFVNAAYVFSNCPRYLPYCVVTSLYKRGDFS